MYHNLVRTEASKFFDTGVSRMSWDLVERTLASILRSPPVLQDKNFISLAVTQEATVN